MAAACLLNPALDSARTEAEWAPDGRWIVHQTTGGETDGAVWVASAGGERNLLPLLKTPLRQLRRSAFAGCQNWQEGLKRQQIRAMPLPPPRPVGCDLSTRCPPATAFC